MPEIQKRHLQLFISHNNLSKTILKIRISFETFTNVMYVNVTYATICTLNIRNRLGDQNLISRAPPCFERHVKPLFPAVFAVVSTHPFQFQGRLTSGGRPVVKIIAESLS
jgi:hypothetical protein